MNIQIANPQQVLDSGNNLLNYVNQSKEYLNDLKNHINSLESAWSSNTNDKISFVESITGTCVNAQAKMDSIQELATTLVNYANDMIASSSKNINY